MAKKPTKSSTKRLKDGKRGFYGGGLTLAQLAQSYPQLQSLLGSGGAGLPTVSTPTATGGAGGLPALSGARGLTTPGGQINIDMAKQIPGSKTFEATAERVVRPALTGPAASAEANPGLLSRLGPQALAGAAGVGAGLATQKGLNYLGSGADMDNVGTIAALNKNAGNEKVVMNGDVPSVVPRNQQAKAPTKEATPTPTSTPAKNAAPAPNKTTTAPKKVAPESGADDSFMADLRASAAKMKDATADMSAKTGVMKDRAADFAGAFKKGGKITSAFNKTAPAKTMTSAKAAPMAKKGDGIARRGFTKGVMR